MSTNLTIHRYPETSNKSLRAWNAGDEYILEQLDGMDVAGKSIAIYNDRFGYLSCHLAELKPHAVIHRKSQEKSILMNSRLNIITVEAEQFYTPFSSLPKSVDIGLMQIPKSVDLFRFFLHKLSESLSDDGIAICAFMTKYFTPALLEIAGDYFEEVDQSLAQKKSRILVLSKKKPLPDVSFIETFSHLFNGKHTETLSQYPGVFSYGQVDYATRFLLDNFSLSETEKAVLDVGSGNGVISKALQLQDPNKERQFHLMDDSILAIESSKLNVDKNISTFHWTDTLDEMEDQSIDLAISNPPFHFGHETNIEISVDLFREVAGVLTPGSRFVCVANQHLGYKPFLKKFFRSVQVLTQNKKFVVYESRK
ncbi:class I SAM-dependent methyltransferase [Rhodohalobacter sp. 8-1]|uniref:class I SAM-dependent methyltransferase n=1 Tax=Rhodohalobacter sp. 8-1 TaxID=3131972 RepID=UPI0030EC85D5